MRNPMLPKTVSNARRWNLAIAGATLAATICKLVLAVKTYGSNDVYAYERFLTWSHYLGIELYEAAWDFNHPPSMLHVFHIFEWLTNVSGVWFPFWLRLPAIMADVGSVLILFRILDRRLHDASIRGALLMFAAAPALILISGFHGNTDSVMLFFLLLSVALLERGLSGRAGMSFGLAMCFKIVPVIALPVIYLYQSSVRKRIAFLGAAGIMLLVSWSPYLLQSPGRG
jgi:Gpi18-like mannosyltransferase